MLEVYGDLFTYSLEENTDKRLICITTNGFVKKNGNLVMGRGCAHTAARMFPHLPKILGELILEHGNRVFILDGKKYDLSLNGQTLNLATFPVKNNWYDKAKMSLIKRSSVQLRDATIKDWDYVVIPRPGCGNGGLRWHDVRPVIGDILIEPMFLAITFDNKSNKS
jgi:hypothetical protein